MDNNIYQILRTLIASQGQPQVEQHITTTSQALTAPQQSHCRGGHYGGPGTFFLTPQVLVNDLSRDTYPTLLVKCVEIDEARESRLLPEFAHEGPRHHLPVQLSTSEQGAGAVHVSSDLEQGHVST
nr:unnamed protein product [Salmo salar]|eukprot:XP_014072090.1 PREDICTED: Fanconi anemia group M protein-like isoform X3 [Salmo salar]